MEQKEIVDRLEQILKNFNKADIEMLVENIKKDL